MKKVFITGMGIVSSIGMTKKDFSSSLKKSISGINIHCSKDCKSHEYIGAYIDGFNIKELLVPYSEQALEQIEKAGKFIVRSPLSIKCATLAAIEAFVDSGLCNGGHEPENTGIIVAGSNINLKLQYEIQEKFKLFPEFVSPTYALQFMDTDHVGVLSEILNIKADGFSIGGASASGNVAIIKAAQLISAGIIDRCFVLGSMADLSPVEIQAFINVGAMAEIKCESEAKDVCRPFDVNHRGFVYGQASGCIVLESENAIEKRRGSILAEVAGWGMNLDGNRLANPSLQGESIAMSMALEKAGILPEDIDYINTHGSSSIIGDKTELDAIKKVFGDSRLNIWINSIKPYTGHCLYSAGVVEAIATVIQMEEGFVHNNINLEIPIDDTFNFVKGDYIKATINNAMSNSFGFGGINTSIILKKE